MNRRLIVFITVFVFACAAGLIYTYTIPPTYVATATIQVDPGTRIGNTPEQMTFAANEAQTLNSNEILAKLADRVRANGLAASDLGDVAALRRVLNARTLPGTNTIQLEAQGHERSRLTQLVDLWAATYLDSRSVRNNTDRTANLDEVRASIAAMEARVGRKRHELDEFRRRHDIVSPEREENEVAAQMRSLTTALNDARNKQIDAESRLSAIQSSISNGSPVYRAQDKAAINQVEQQILDLRQKLKDLELKYTSEYLAVEPGVKTMRANLRQLEQQIEKLQKEAQQATVNEAMQDVVLAKKNVSRLEAQLSDRRADAQQFTSQFAEHKSRTTELAQMEGQLGQAKERLTRLEGTERSREARYELLGRAAAPERPSQPDYTLYGALSIGGALLAALLAVMLVEFLSPRPKPQPGREPMPIIQIAYPALANAPRIDALQLSGRPAQLPLSGNRLALERSIDGSRELTVAEVRALWDAATDDGRLAIAALFAGVTLEELASLDWADVDLSHCEIRLHHPERSQTLLRPLIDELRVRAGADRPGGHIAADATGSQLSVRDLEGLVAAAAHDAGVPHAYEVEPHVLRHTYISFLVRQGVRLSELEKVVGTLPAAVFLQYRAVSPEGPGRPLTTLDCVFPAFA